MNYKDRLKISLDGNLNTEFYTSCKFYTIAKGYNRIVIGDRGPYIEFNKDQIFYDVIWIPPDCKWRLQSKSVYYLEYRSKDQSCVKIYFQKRVVNYADYKVVKYNISPFDLYVNGEVLISKLKGES